jgi:predicted lipid-binding transport protein (Tim44 family)
LGKLNPLQTSFFAIQYSNIKTYRINMSGQLLELIIFAAIAFFIINKLIATLGSTSEEDAAQGKSYFKGGAQGLRDVTNSAKRKATILKPKFPKVKKINLKDLVVPGSEEEVIDGLTNVMEKIPNFNLSNFIKGATSAFNMIITAGSNENEAELEELVDKRYIEHFKAMTSSYGKYSAEKNALTAQVSEIYMFGNNVFVKILFAGKNITDKIKVMHEEWTFTKSILNSSPQWHLTNIDRPQ